MGLRDTFLNMLGVETPEVQKTDNSALRSARDFLSRGNRTPLYADWAEIKVPDDEMYSGYTYAVIQKRSNKVARLAKTNLKTYAKPEVVDEFQKKNETVYHPYLKLIEDSTDFTEKQFWKNISIYLDLAGRYYLGVIRSSIRPVDPKLPTITTDPVKFVMLNPYEIRRVIDKDKNVAGYIERKKDGRYREWPLHQIIEMRELNPFDPENGHWAMTDAAKEAVYTINQSGDYTRHSLSGNIDAPGIITTDVLLSDEDFANFRARVTQHTKGEPLFGNGSGAIKWDSMQVDLDKAALMDINEINRTTLFAVSGTSKTSLGIEQSGTTRETARVQSEQFVSDTAEPRLEDIVDFLNLDYKKYYNREYQKTGYCIEVESSIGKDYDTEQKATALKQSQFQLAMQLMQSGYTMESSYQFAEGEIDFADLELEKGLDKPKNPEEPESPEDDGGNDNPDDEPDDEPKSPREYEEEPEEDLNGLSPHSDLVANGGKGSGNFGHSGRPGEIGGSGKGGIDAKIEKLTVHDKKYTFGDDTFRAKSCEFLPEPDVLIIEGEGMDPETNKRVELVGWLDNYPNDTTISKALRYSRLKPLTELAEQGSEDWDIIAKTLKHIDWKSKNSVEGENSLPLAVEEVHCTCEHDHKIETFINEVNEDEGKIVDNAYKDFLQEVREIEKETIDASARKVEVNAFEISDIIGPRKRKALTEKLKNAIHQYWWLIFPLFANNSIAKRNEEFSKNIKFIFNNELQAGVDSNALRVAEGHMETILNDVLEASNRAYTNVLEDAAAEILIKVYDDSPTKWEKYFEHKPTKAEALASIRKTDILEENRKIYEKANTMAFEGYNRRDIVKAIREEYKDISENRAKLIARNETSRAFTRSQFEADRQFLNGVGKLDQAYKVWYSRRPWNEQDKICDFCNEMIRMSEENPIPFEQPFLAYGDSLEVTDNDGKLRIFTANYEDIDGGTLHPNCQCGYHLVFMNEQGEFTKTLNDGPDDKTLNGGPGSGNHGHAGRPGEIGGSAKDKLNGSKDFKDWTASLDEESEGEFSKDLGAIEKEFSDMGLDLSKIKVTTKLDDIPEYARSEVKETLDGQAFARKDGRGIVFLNEKHLSEYGLGSDEKYQKGLPLDKQVHNTSTLPLATLRHELGHIVHDALYAKSRLKKITSGQVQGYKTESFCHGLVEKALGQKIGAGFHTEMSVYGTKNWKEYIAESFANPNFSSHTRKIYDYCVKEMKRLSGDEKEENSAKKGDWVPLCLGYVVKGMKKKVKNGGVDFEDITISGVNNDTSNSLDRDSVAGGIDNDFGNEQTTKSVNGGPGSGNFGHAGRPGEVGGSSKDGQGVGLVDKYPEVTDIAKRLAEKRPEGNLTDEYLDEVKKERKQLFEKYGEDKFRTDKKIQKWNDGWYMWGEKEEEDGGKIFSDIDIALSQAIVKECNNNTTVYRTQIDSNYNGEMLPSEHSSWTTSLTEAYRWGNFIGGVNSSIDLFETKVSPSNIVLVPDIMYSVTGLFPIQQQEYVLSNKTNLKASKRGMTWQEVRDEYEKLSNSVSVQNGGVGSGNFGHSGRPGLVGGSGGGIGKFLFDGDLPSKNPQPTKEGYVVVHHNTDNETADAIAKEGLVAGKNLGAYQVSPEEGLGIWTDSRAKTDSSYGGCTISFQIPKEEYEKYAVNDTQHLIPHNIAREDIVCIDKIINENGSNGKAIKVSNLKDNVDYYTKKGLDENKVISIIAKNSHGIITEQEIKELVDFKKKVANGGPGSGNFGHAGRPGEVGGSAPSGMTIPNPASRIIRESDYNKPEFIARLKELGWTDEQIEAGRKRAIVGRLSKTILRKPDVEKFDTKIGPRLKELGVDDDTLESLRDMVVKGAEKNKSTRTPEQAEAVDEFVNTGIILKASDEKFLRNSVPEEMVRILTEEVKNAQAEGLDIFRTRVQFTTAVKKGGSCTVDEFGNILVRLTKRDMSDLAMTTARNKRLGPNGEKWWTSEELAGTVRHELGHALAWQANKIHNGNNYYRYHSICSDIVTMANDRFTKATGATDWDTRHERRMDLRKNENYKYMSKYGQTNSMEVIAESYANPNYSEYTKEVVKSLQAYLKGEKLW